MQAPPSTFQNHLFCFDKGELDPHRNLMPCVIFGRDTPVVVSGETDVIEGHIICIKPDILHRVQIGSGGADIIYFDGLGLDQRTKSFSRIDAKWRRFPDVFHTQDAEIMEQFRRSVEGVRPPPDPKVMENLAKLYAHPHQRMSQMDLAQSLGLERTQALRHFKETTGQTFRKFKIWTALIDAAHRAHAGEQIGLAGMDAGFSDAAHLARTARATFGLTPTMGLAGLSQLRSM